MADTMGTIVSGAVVTTLTQIEGLDGSMGVSFTIKPAADTTIAEGKIYYLEVNFTDQNATAVNITQAFTAGTGGETITAAAGKDLGDVYYPGIVFTAITEVVTAATAKLMHF